MWLRQNRKQNCFKSWKEIEIYTGMHFFFCKYQLKSFKILAELRQSVWRVCGIHLCVIAPAGNTAPFEKMWQQWRTVGNTVSALTGPRFEPQTSSSKDERDTARPTGQLIFLHYIYSASCRGLETTTFSLRAATCTPHAVEASRVNTLSMLSVKRGSCENQFYSLLTPSGIKPQSTVSTADALSTRPLIGLNMTFRKVNFQPSNKLIWHLQVFKHFT